MHTFLYILLLGILAVGICGKEEILSDNEWLKKEDDIEILANAALKEMKRSSSIHLYDDISIVRILEHRKTIAGYSRSLFLKVSISSMHFENEKAENLLSMLVLQHKQNNKYSFAIPDYPKMKESYLHSMEEKWADIHREQRNQHFEELREYTSSDDFENQSYLYSVY